VVATFARDAVPPTEVEVIVVTQRDEVRYRILSDAWSKLHQ
jgi:hypothetical protein